MSNESDRTESACHLSICNRVHTAWKRIEEHNGTVACEMPIEYILALEHDLAVASSKMRLWKRIRNGEFE